jgi:hypothetical protein
MDKETRYHLYKGFVYPGWWPILDTYIPRILTIDPTAEIEAKEKYGTLRLWIGSELEYDWTEIIEEAEEISKEVCEICSEPGKLRTDCRWLQTLCNRCAVLDPADRYRVSEEVAAQRALLGVLPDPAGGD